MPKIKEEYDVVIIGSGLGGLLCGYVLAQEGKSVCILEKNAQIGGNLQTFKRDKVKFDSGVHYIGGLDKGQALYPFFKYFNLFENVEKELLDKDGYDVISFENDDILYPHGQGYENFVQQLLKHFPKEEEGLRKYCDEIKRICEKFEWYNLHIDYTETDEMSAFSLSAKEVIADCTSDQKLQKVLAGSNLLYAGEGDSSPFYIHALIIDSYIGSAYKLKHSDQISKQLRKDIKKMGGEIFINTEVTKIENTAKQVQYVVLSDGQTIKGKQFISNMHPTQTFKLLNTEGLRKVNVNRMLQLENTVSSFILYIKLKPDTFKFSNSNRYHFIEDDVWNTQKNGPENKLKALAIFNSRPSKDTEYSHTLTAMAYMNYEEVRKWENSFNTTLSESERSGEYVKFKREKAEELIAALSTVYPGFTDCIESYYTATPLTQRDYIGAIEGGLYGIKKDFNAPVKSFISANTKLDNLFLTGQNVILHGVLGVTISAMVTCQFILGKKYMLDKLKAYV
ncbi:phytoene desaturase family protein [Algoriphagus aquimarinus]|uniref:Phytoene dehydrogenase-related protein n=1 Tax=Algoriphagus aquimarinus TaxID=237018 RepID=A0A1I0XYS7_9BACT|nr:NAD(P)/FAD-dependent oxidoreductase [Algoriphagus aquimarinus]SFB05817.1 Phytoene dehydrogenase-related protein [Algoriphagus aquimarinus]